MSIEQLTVKQGAKITGEVSGDYFGYSVSISASGDTIVVGAYRANSNTGYAKVYKNISGTWTQQGAKITGEATSDRFGISVSISATGDTIVVGAYGANSNTGYAKVYKNISGTWQQGAKITGETSFDHFGISVSISATGDTIVVGAYGANDGTGYAKVYKNISGTWQQGAKITGETSFDHFGTSVSISATGDTIVVGAHYSNSNTGYAKVYKNISGTWTLQGAKITGEVSGDYFGYSVSISASGGAIVVGAYGANDGTGYAKVYKNISGTWTLQGAKIIGEANNDYFGTSVSISATGDTIVVGAHYSNSNTGYAKVYKNISGTWTLQGAKITGEVSGDYFGYSVSISASGDTIVVGADYANSDTGAAYIFDLQPEGINKVPENQSIEGLLCTITTELTMENASHIDTACQALGTSLKDYVNHCIRLYAEYHYQEVLDLKKCQ